MQARDDFAFGSFDTKPFTGITLFSGGGIAECGLNRLVQMVGAVEVVPDVADHYRSVWGNHIINDSVEDVNYRQFRGIDYGHASPSCRHASIANQSGGECEGDTDSGMAIERFLDEARPKVFTLENVRGYRHFKAFKSILRCLEENRYTYRVDVLNAADYGTPQTRQRLFIRAWLGAEPIPDMVPTHSKGNWNGWYAAIEDLIPYLPESQFAPWQLARLPAHIADNFIAGVLSSADRITRGSGEPAFTTTVSHSAESVRAFVLNGDNYNTATVRIDTEPSQVVVAGNKGFPKAFVVHPTADNDRFPVRQEEEPIFTVLTGSSKARAFVVNTRELHGGSESEAYYTHRPDDEPAYTIAGSSSGSRHKAWLEEGRVVSLNTRCLARFQDVPDWYPLTGNNAFDCGIIGNGVPARLMKAVAESLLLPLRGK